MAGTNLVSVGWSFCLLGGTNFVTSDISWAVASMESMLAATASHAATLRGRQWIIVRSFVFDQELYSNEFRQIAVVGFGCRVSGQVVERGLEKSRLL